MKVLYRPEQSVDSNESLSPSAQKPGLFVEAIRSIAGLEIDGAWDQVTREDLYQVHQRDHVDAVLDCRERNGFGNRNPEVASSLLFTNGSFLAAARTALEEGIAISPTSGFHHADYSKSMGFCTFNGLMLAAVAIHRERPSCRIGIVDFDMHWGNGTVDIIRKLGLDYVSHLAFSDQVGNDYEDWLSELPESLQASMGACDLLFYQAGADPHIEDPLGGELSTDQMARRDRLVFEFGRRRGKALAWNLAGGYQDPVSRVIDLHLATVRECLRVFGAPDLA